MKKVSSSPSNASLLFLFSLLAVTMLVEVKGQICSENYGSCDGRTTPDCNKFCASNRPRGNGSCDATDYCRCFYPCAGRGDKKLCKYYVGPNPQGGCSDEDCDSTCSQKFPGSDQDGHGLCQAVEYPNLACYCIHLC
ncbi:hypothetical protein CICLE_v10009861mg [Citrus x clementina]|uniref:Defensin-like protein n=1 Tax=Citrus clementina TaxID=85681 RepID=V4U137_CITCL|nr:defensin-like protein 181 [Citrus x clementina]ESR66553.1 hypothetical protein CICLE_v10009861mg [Citrus x clementina]GAY37196.1 hypothetical protein CUMW_027190 [Citrus unshiu]